ncbi:MAG TPA: 50S ribosomal protein L1 [bacterium]|nr:50S ribosomal protein L1 [bacterium]
MKKRGKKYLETAKNVDQTKSYSVQEAVDLVKKSSRKFNETVDMAVRLNVNPKKADQNVRGVLLLPHGTGKKVRICVVAKGEKYKEAEALEGVSAKGPEEFVQEVEKGKIDFDVLIAAPDSMKELGRVAKILGPKGLMPNPRSGTVTFEIRQIVEKLKKGQYEFRVDVAGILHLVAGKVSFDKEKLVENIQEIIRVIQQVKPSSVKGQYVRSITLSSTMGPGISIASEIV